ncbi:nicotinate-nucleotide pyrophosphorylase [carboxylating] [Saccharopolyspora erythraea NRRL 2338]|uniref:Nicotinate-nucleotide pyrophosphorylase [carboxylating] n=2 Tax=Saccharopolyspora erythraea TaxID=1836 RepID=A4FLR0_SACEN|nr:carboxylating nicotinate-nucleotide diphosphorylase [Saccharopolyspora erythraea]EQD88149.1 nicotinate-nucleotide pyrophosphorylase [Saccharopolyspora erythraea D]PFG98622.1 nicotinate-nucleotide pyrophosphorylase [carboxylating] [Saccharopolyspora erythraea NRRL 2338]QRK88655.1 carboxylating nicotinate-nucleotide diphosphorylase [Saccharopolyspora erythraea]CAM04985.1 nicotinate-nucleotide pyrophosphorylase (carboxylating) [Saccharopolyspora erythraea NRRL 2338]
MTTIAGLEPDEAKALVRTALTEDLRYGPDATTEATVPADAVAEAAFNTRRAGVVAGLPLVRVVLDEVLGDYEVLASRSDGDRLAAGDCALRVRARVGGLLTAERTALNLLCHLSGIATATSEWVSAVEGTGCRIRDSRKTLPGLRLPQKYAVRCGGGTNHRLGLGDAVLIKDNHVVAAGSVVAAVRACRAHAPGLPMEVEVSTLDELDAVLAEDVELVLLDNFTPQQCAEAVRRAAAVSPATELEASGGLTLDVARAYAETGVHYLAVGGLTHSSPALDLGLDM